MRSSGHQVKMKIKRSGFFFLSCLLLLSGALFADQRSIEDRRMFADGLYARGMHALAVEEYRALLDDFPELAGQDVVWFRLGECLRAQGAAAEAEQAYRRVFVDFPDSSLRHKAGFQRAALFAEMDRYAEAAELFGEVLAAKPPREVKLPAAFYRGEALLRLGRREAAWNAYYVVSGEEQSEFSASALLRMGDLISGDSPVSSAPQEETARHQTALGYYRKALSAAKTSRERAEALFHVGRISYLLNNYKESAEYYGRLIDEYPEDLRTGEARLQAAWAAFRAGLYQEAAQVAEQAISSKVDSADEWLYLRANCERQLMNRKEALQLYDRLLTQHRKSARVPAAQYERAVVLYSLGRYQEALKSAEDIRGDVRRGDVLWLAAESAAALPDKDKAVQYYRLLIKEAGNVPQACDARYRLGFLLQERESWREAAETYLGLLEHCAEHPDAAAALFSAGVCHWELNSFTEALRLWNSFIHRFPNHRLIEEVMYRKALCLLEMEDSDSALKAFQDLPRRFTESVYRYDAYYWQGVLLDKAGKSAEAEQAFEKAMLAEDEATAEAAAVMRGALLYKLERFSEAADVFMQVVNAAGAEKIEPAMLEWLSTYEYEQGRLDNALTAAELLIRVSGDGEWRQAGWTLAARAQREAGDLSAAEEAYRMALKETAVTEYAPEAALRLGEILAEAGKRAEAREWAGKAAEWSVSESLLAVRARAYMLLGNIAEESGATDDAISFYLSVGILFDDSELVPRALGRAVDLLEKAGRNEEAERIRAELDGGE